MNELQVIKYSNNRVITTQQLAEAYETEPNNIVKNFSRNESRFIIGRDYYLLEGDDLKLFKNDMTNSHFVNPKLNKLYLWTDRGANRHCKILDTDKAWDQFDVLEENYFQTRVNLIKYNQLSTQLSNTIDQKLYNIIIDPTKTAEQADNEIDMIINNIRHSAYMKIISVPRVKINQLSKFIDDCCELGDDYIIDLTELYATYFAWCVNIDKKPESKTNFKNMISEHDEIAYLKSDYRHGLNARFMGVKLYGDSKY